MHYSHCLRKSVDADRMLFSLFLFLRIGFSRISPVFGAKVCEKLCGKYQMTVRATRVVYCALVVDRRVGGSPHYSPQLHSRSWWGFSGRLGLMGSPALPALGRRNYLVAKRVGMWLGVGVGIGMSIISSPKHDRHREATRESVLSL